MREYIRPHGSVRGRVTEPTVKPKLPVKPSVGLRMRLPGPLISVA